MKFILLYNNHLVKFYNIDNIETLTLNLEYCCSF